MASQTRVLEAAADPGGSWVPSTPAVAVVPHDPHDVDRLTAVLCAPPVSAWVVGQAAGTALSADAVLACPRGSSSTSPFPGMPTPGRRRRRSWPAGTWPASAGRPPACTPSRMPRRRRSRPGGEPAVRPRDGSRCGLPPPGGCSVGSPRHQERPGDGSGNLGRTPKVLSRTLCGDVVPATGQRSVRVTARDEGVRSRSSEGHGGKVTARTVGERASGAWLPGDPPGHRQFLSLRRPGLRPRGRRGAPRRHRRLRDLGDARRRRRPTRCWSAMP